MSVAVLGGGAFGTALAVSLAQNGPVTLWARDAAVIDEIATHRTSPRLPGCALPDAITPTTDLAHAAGADVLLLSVPMQALADLLEIIPVRLAGKALVACSKGIELRTLCGPAAVIARHAPDAIPAILTGPSFAADIGRGLPTALTLACADADTARSLQTRLSTPNLRLYRTADTVGAELGGALKNVVAIACGTAIGLGLGDSARAALMTRGFSEMQRLAAHLGADPDTLTGLSGMGDLALTCHSELSRNFRHGAALGAGKPVDARATVEGVATARALDALARRDGLDLPICTAVNAIAGGDTAPEDAMRALLTRPLKEE
ncbi:NAD(P)H-dependent glycerol-3-phosphate dehydrogenase [Citreimonas salinaria]|uniref:Glycerol-3-phosphate dehydrogenase [NAD(P)+] n=1 Tax=Citreimonas salinaria TaxID=321339 RepID=A0A1H3FBV9_9RHOB|nr:NAD(P)H-dependent glycerol-3-phosphate dehydrogenase [Citreimonas salinaria]SDX87674.1 glycerol-3-phosphate dehydrogenase (NAD(P)+) [Citreimonas salinaria]